jgi:outer membrane lipoprotein-sorting protein
MSHKPLLLLTFALLMNPAGISADGSSASAKMTVAEILNKNAEALGGLQNWKGVLTLSMSGKMDVGGTPPMQLPVLLEMKRPRKSRVELQFKGDTAIQVFDGTNGWKFRPYLNRRDVEPYTAEEMKAAALQSDLDGPLMDYNAKGYSIELMGTGPVEGRNTYTLRVTQKDGQSRRVWVDAEAFLELKIEGIPRRLDGKQHPVATFLRDYRTVNGLKVPYTIETSVEGVKQTERILIEKVVVNPPLQDSLFGKPQ